MPTYTTNYNLAKPLVNSAVDQDLWGGELNSDMDIIDTTMKTISDAVTALRLPIGSLYWNKSNATNPSDITMLGYGTWVAITDKFVVARGSTYTSTGGNATVALTTNELPPHNHFSGIASGNNNVTMDVYGGSTSGIPGSATNSIQVAGVAATHQGVTSSTGSGAAFSIIPVYQAAYCWERTA